MNRYTRNSKVAAYQSAAAHGGVAGADPHALVQMLMDAVVERLVAARGCIERRQIVRKAKLLHSSVILLGELRGSLNLDRGGSIAENLSNLYDYMVRQLVLANSGSEVARDAGRVTEVLDLLNEIRGAWTAIGPEVRQAQTATAPGAAAAAGATEGTVSVPSAAAPA